jgi:hypothetical protein
MNNVYYVQYLFDLLDESFLYFCFRLYIVTINDSILINMWVA